MLKFKIFEIPEGQSQQSVELKAEELELGDYPFNGGSLDIEFNRTTNFIQVKFDLHANVELICDRSLDAFEFTVDKHYEVLFKADEVEESADANGAIRNINHKSQLIDLEQDVHDTIMLDLPVKKLHPRFLDEDGNPKEFLNEQFGDDFEEDEDAIDPRWEALKELKK